MDRDPPSNIPPPDTVTPLSCRLHGFPETCLLERVPPTNNETHSREVPGCAIAPPSPCLQRVRYIRIQS